MTDYYKEYERKNPAKFKRRFDISLLKNPKFLSFIQTRNSFILKERRKLRKNVKMCDVGAGTGLATIELKKHLPNKDFIAEVDNSLYLLKKFKSKGRICADALKLPFENNTFDIVFCMDVLHHVDNMEGAVKEMLRISKNKVIIIEPNKFNPIYFLHGIINKEERGILRVGYKKIISFIGKRKYTLEFIEPFPFHLLLMKTPYRWFSKLFGKIGIKKMFATYIITISRASQE